MNHQCRGRTCTHNDHQTDRAGTDPLAVAQLHATMDAYRATKHAPPGAAYDEGPSLWDDEP